MNNRAFSKIWIIIILIVLITEGIFAWQYSKTQGAEVSLPTLVEKIEQGEVKSITIQDHHIKALLKDGEYLSSEKEKGISLTETLLNYGASKEKLKNIEIIVKEKGVLGTWVLPFSLFIFPIIGIYGIAFLVSYFLILLGLKILKIEGIAKSKIIVYILIMFLIGAFLQPVINKSLAGVFNAIILYLINSLISFGIALILLKYYFLLFGKKLWLFFLYLVVINLIFLGLSTLLL